MFLDSGCDIDVDATAFIGLSTIIITVVTLSHYPDKRKRYRKNLVVEINLIRAILLSGEHLKTTLYTDME